MELAKRYDPKESEEKWQKYWETEGVYKFDAKSRKKIYSIDTPPPTVSGKMHLGHAFSYTQQDFLVRYHRMKGENIFYPWGFDDNGLATERFVENKLKIKGTEMPRKEFTKLCLKETKDAEKKLQKAWQRLGISPDWDNFYRTIDDNAIKAAQLSFIELYEKKRAYRNRTPFLWCPECQTSIAQVELKDKEQKSHLVYINFDTSIGERIGIATTRPELMPACISIHVHPKDKRFKKFVGAKAKIPFSDREVEIIENEDVDMEFGTGVVYHCTFGDMDDVEWIFKYNFPVIEIMEKDGRFNSRAGKYEGMKTMEARKAIVQDLEKAGHIEKIADIKNVVNTHERCDTPIEILMTEQWFLKYLDLKKKFLELGKNLNWYPKFMKARYDNWVKGLKYDWNLSRQRFYGVPFPVWYCKKCEEIIIADKKDLPVDPLEDSPKQCPKCKSKDFIPEKDVMDTWATSSLTPQISLNWVENDKLFEKIFPMSLRPQAHDIITFWLFNTVVKSYLHHNKLPWKDVMISGHALDEHGKKMSKSKGNVVDPLETIDSFSADSLRFWSASSKLGDDLPFQEKELVTGQKFITKLWNSARFVFMNLEDYKKGTAKLEVIDKWALSKLSGVIKGATESFENYEYFRTKADTEFYFWHLLCDNYLEIVKDRIYNEDKRGKESKKAAQHTLYEILLSILKLMAPIMPHITEELYQLFYKKHEKEKSIHVAQWPKPYFVDKKAEELGEVVIQAISVARRAKTDKNLSLKTPVKKMVLKANISEKDFKDIEEDIKATVNAEDIEFSKGKEFSCKVLV